MSQWHLDREEDESFEERHVDNHDSTMAPEEGTVFHGLPSMNHWHQPASHLQGPPPGTAFGRSPYRAPPMNPQQLSFRDVQPVGPGPFHGLPICPPQPHHSHAHPSHAHHSHAHPSHAYPSHAHPTPAHLTPAHSSGYRADEGYVADGLRRGIPIEQLIPADPDEEYRSQAGRSSMQQQQGVPVRSAGAGQVDFATRLAAMETRSEEEQKDRLRLEAKLDGLTDMLKKLNDSKTQPVAPAVPAASVIQNNGPAATPDELNARLQRIGQRLPARHDENRETPQHLAAQAMAMTANLRLQRQAGEGEDELMEEGDVVAGGRTTNPAYKRRSFSGSVAAGANRAKRARHNTADEAEEAVHSDPLPFPEALGTPGEPQQAVEAPQPANPIGQLSGPGAAGPVPSGNDGDDDGLRWARDFLAFIKRMDCTSDADLLRLKKYVKGKASFEFPLCTSIINNRTKYCYFLKVGGSLSTTLSLNPGNRPEQPKSAQDEVENLNIFESYLDRNCPPTTNNAYREYRPPTYLAPLGEVYRADRSTDRPEDVISTNFFVFMDVGRPQKSIWLMYRYEKPLECRNRVQWRPVSFLGQRDSIFRIGGFSGFDTVCVLEDIKDWKDPSEEMVRVSRLAEALPRDGSIVLRPVFFTPDLERLREAIKMGWEGAGREE